MKRILKTILAILVFILLSSNVCAQMLNTDDIDRKSYVIGTHLFNGDAELTIHHIMLAAKTIEGDDIDDMVIYYKNARGNWIDGYSGEAVAAPSNFEITHINLVPQAYVPKPTLVNETIENAVDGEVLEFSEGKFTYHIGINPQTYADLDDDYFYELYVKDGENLVKIAENIIEENYYFEINPGEIKTLVAKVYILDANNEKVYSVASNELIVGTNTLTPPIISNATLSEWNSSHPNETYIPEVFNGTYRYELAIDNLYGAYWEAEGLYTPAYQPNGYYLEIYSKRGNQGSTKLFYTTPLSSDNYFITINPGEKETFTAKVYALASDGTKLYSEPSNEIEIDGTITLPILHNDTIEAWNIENPNEDYVAEAVNGKYIYELSIDEAAYTASGEEFPDVSYFFEVYASTANQTSFVSTETVGYPVEVYVEPGEAKTFKAHVCVYDSDDNKVCSDYSNEIEIDHTTTTTLLDMALDSITDIDITSGGESLTRTYEGCTITLVPAESIAEIERGLEDRSININASVTCGKLSGSKTVNGIIKKSELKYTTVLNQNEEDYTIKVFNERVMQTGYKLYNLAGTLLATYNSGTDYATISSDDLSGYPNYKLIFNNDLHTTYIVSQKTASSSQICNSLSEKETIDYMDFYDLRKEIAVDVYDDYPMIRAAHSCANTSRKDVSVTKGIYNIYKMDDEDPVNVKTSTNFNDSTIYIHDEVLKLNADNSLNYNTELFTIAEFSGSCVNADVSVIDDFDSIVDLAASYYDNSYVRVVTKNTDENVVFIRSGGNADDGVTKYDSFRVKNGVVLDKLFWNKDNYTDGNAKTLRICKISDTKLEFKNATFRTIVATDNSYKNAKPYVNRNIRINRSNTKIDNIKHVCVSNQNIEHPENESLVVRFNYSYQGFLRFHQAADIEFTNSVVYGKNGNNNIYRDSTYDVAINQIAGINISNVTMYSDEQLTQDLWGHI